MISAWKCELLLRQKLQPEIPAQPSQMVAWWRLRRSSTVSCCSKPRESVQFNNRETINSEAFELKKEMLFVFTAWSSEQSVRAKHAADCPGEQSDDDAASRTSTHVNQAWTSEQTNVSNNQLTQKSADRNLWPRKARDYWVTMCFTEIVLVFPIKGTVNYHARNRSATQINRFLCTSLSAKHCEAQTRNVTHL